MSVRTKTDWTLWAIAAVTVATVVFAGLSYFGAFDAAPAITPSATIE